LDYSGALDAVAGEGEGKEPGLGDFLPAFFAAAKGSLVDTIPGSGDFLKNMFFVFHQAEGELLLETGGAEVRHVDWHMGQVGGGFLSWFAQSFICQVRYVAVKAALQSEQSLPVLFEFDFGHRHPPMKAPHWSSASHGIPLRLAGQAVR
jgi:hypothetical protein